MDAKTNSLHNSSWLLVVVTNSCWTSVCKGPCQAQTVRYICNGSKLQIYCSSLCTGIFLAPQTQPLGIPFVALMEGAMNCRAKGWLERPILQMHLKDLVLFSGATLCGSEEILLMRWCHFSTSMACRCMDFNSQHFPTNMLARNYGS